MKYRKGGCPINYQLQIKEKQRRKEVEGQKKEEEKEVIWVIRV